MKFSFQLVEHSSELTINLPEGLTSRRVAVESTRSTYLDIVAESRLKSALDWYRTHLSSEYLDRVYVTQYPDPRICMTVREMCEALGIK